DAESGAAERALVADVAEQAGERPVEGGRIGVAVEAALEADGGLLGAASRDEQGGVADVEGGGGGDPFDAGLEGGEGALGAAATLGDVGVGEVEVDVGRPADRLFEELAGGAELVALL